MKYKQKVDFGVSCILFLIGVALIVLPMILTVKVRILMTIIMTLYAIINLIQFLLTYKSKDYEGLLTFIVSLVVGLLNHLYLESNPLKIALILIVWITLMAIVKLKKADYYNDRKDRMWKLRVLLLGIFIAVGLTTAVSFNYSDDTKIIVLGYFFLIHSILEMIDPVVKYLLLGKKD